MQEISQLQIYWPDYKQHVRSERLEEPSGHHFNTPGHSLSHLAGLVLEHVRNPDPFVLKAREFLYIQKFDTFNNGLNKRPWVCPSWAKFVEFMCVFFWVVPNLLLVTINLVSLQWTSSSLRVKYIFKESKTVKQFCFLVLSFTSLLSLKSLYRCVSVISYSAVTLSFVCLMINIHKIWSDNVWTKQRWNLLRWPLISHFLFYVSCTAW